MRRTSLSTKLLAAALPLVIAIGTLLAFTVRSGLADVNEAEDGAELGRVWSPLITTLNGISNEQAQMQNVVAGIANGMPNAEVQAILGGSRLATDEGLAALDTSIDRTDLGDIADGYLSSARDALDTARGTIDLAMLLPDDMNDGNPVRDYAVAMDELVSIGRVLPAQAGSPDLGRELLAVVSLADAALAAGDIIIGTSRWPNATDDRTPLLQADAAFDRLDIALDQFVATAPEAWVVEFDRSGFARRIAEFGTDLDLILANASIGPVREFDTDAFAEFVGQGVQFQTSVSEDIVQRASADADTARRETLVRISIILGAIALAGLITWFLTRSIARRVRAVADSANSVATEQLPALVEAIRDPRGKAVIPEVAPVDASGHDELSELAAAFNSMQGTLVDVAQEQVEVLRRGVSDIFVTMARRNRSLIDRQLAMLDEFEAEVDDPDVLANYYQLDHLATRMRRNSESLLVLANAEPKRRRVKATEIDDVVRASIGEVEDYRRIDIEALESLQVRGNVVADISHLLAELLDNATSFSPPDSMVRVGGRRAGDSYMLRIVDDGVGIGAERMRELNELLREPPVVGLSVESTLGMSVVSLLANKYGIDVTLSAGNPGLTVDVVLPSSLFGPIDVPFGVDGSAGTTPPAEPEEQLVEWSTDPDQGADESFVAAPAPSETRLAGEPLVAPMPEVDLSSLRIEDPPPASPEAPVAPAADAALPPVATADFDLATRPPEPPIDPGFVVDDERAVVASDWTKMSLELSAFKSGQESATDRPDGTETTGDDDTSEFTSFPELDGLDGLEAAAAPPVDPLLPSRSPSAPPDGGRDRLADAQDDVPTLRALDEPTLQPIGEPTLQSTGEPTLQSTGEPTMGEPAATPQPVASVFDAPTPAEGVARPDLPAPTLHGEFDVPPAPPIATGGPSAQPVTPEGARHAPLPRVEEAAEPSLPTRSPSAPPDGGPDRLAGVQDAATAASADDEVNALETALAAFGDLPSRPAGGSISGGFSLVDDSPAATASRHDPDALRERLRAFQSEFKTGADGVDGNSNESSDLGGDRR